MLGKQSFDWKVITKYITVFGAIFSNMSIKRYDVNGNVIGDIMVPIQYAPKEKMLTRALGDPEISRQFSELLPRMSFEIKSIEYDGSRKLNPTQRYSVLNTTNSNQVTYQYNPVPYNINVLLYVYAKNVDDANQIIEQILPFFTPDWTANIQLIPSMNQEFKTPIVLQNVDLNDLYDGEFKDRRVLLWTLTFQIKGYIFGATYQAPVIKFSTTNVRVGNTINNQIDQTITTTPGLDANGNPTSNAAVSIPVSQIFANSDWGFVINAVSLIN